MKKSTFLTLFLSLLISLTVFSQKGYINPAAKYCEILGYRYEITTAKAGGEIGMVHLPDGSIVNAWDFFKGKVAPEFSYAAKLGFDVETETVKENGYVIERAVCVRSNKGVEERIPLLELMELNGDPLNAEVHRNVPSIQEIAKVDPAFSSAKSLPTEFDWRNYNGHSYIGEPRNQGGCGSCYSFGASACAEGAYNLATNSYDNNTADFSEAYIAWCLSTLPAYSSHFSGCNGADYDYQELQALVDVGTIDESYFPYSDADNQSCPSSTESAPKIQFEGWYRVPCADVDAIKTAIMTYGVVDAAVYVSTSFQNYSGGVFTDSYTTCSSSPCYNTTTNHAISLVGWGHDATEGDYWILRNSWGSSWGEGGYMKLSVHASHIDCSVCYMVYQDVAQSPVAAFSASETSVLYGNSVSFTDQSTNNPTSWSWLFEGGTPSTSTSQNPTVTYNTPGTYNVTLTATNAEGNDSEIKTDYITVVNEIIPEYCTSAGNNFSYEWISSVKVGAFTNTSTAAGYTDFTSKTISMNAGTAYAVTLTPGFASSTYNEYWKIWVDLNYDGDFDDSGELIFDAGALSKTAVTGTATIPSGTSAKTTRMRVSMKYNSAQTACEAFSYGEVEDYTVVISSGGDTQAPTAPTSLSSSNITETSFTLSWNASSDNVGVTGYDVYRNGSLLASTSGTSYNVSGLTESTTYVMTVKAKDAAGNISNVSSSLNVTTLDPPDTQAPTAPTSLVSSSITQTSFTLNWNASTDNVGVTGYDVYQNGSLLSSVTGTSASITSLTASTTYAMTVKAKDLAGNVSATSSTLNVTTADQSGGGCTGGITSYPYSEGFESGIGAWTQDASDDFDWAVDANGTPSSSTGPSAADEGTYYIYVESSSPNYPSKVATLNSPCFDLTAEDNASFNFAYHMYGSSMGTIVLQASTDGSSWTTLWTKSGDQGNSWYNQTISLSSYYGTSVQLRYVATTSTSYTSDFAIDDISVTTGSVNPIGTDLTLTITFDNYPEETSWTLKNSGGSTVASGGTYASQADGSTLVIPINDLADDCYDFTILDAYGDGICCSYGSGSYTLEVTGGSTLASGGSFTSSEVTNFCLPNANYSSRSVNVNEIGNGLSTVNIYPNPASTFINIDVINGHRVGTIRIYNTVGTLVKTLEMNGSEKEINISELPTGLYIISIEDVKEPLVKYFIKK